MHWLPYRGKYLLFLIEKSLLILLEKAFPFFVWGKGRLSHSLTMKNCILV